MMDAMENELAKLLNERVQTVVFDIVDTARRGGLSREDIITMVVTVLMAQATTALIAGRYSELAAVKLCSVSYQEVAKAAARLKLTERRH